MTRFSDSTMQAKEALQAPANARPLPRARDLQSMALLLDIDGTIVDVAVTPGSVVVSETLIGSLKELYRKCGGALALVSGRLISDIDALFAPLRLPAIGAHGAEMRLAADAPVSARTADAIGEGIRKLVAAAADVDPRVTLEDKSWSLAVHYRLAPHVEDTLKSKIAAVMARVGVPELEVMHGKAVIEIKSNHFSKGAAVRELMKHPPFLHRRPVFVGDDTTDETVFEILPPLGGVGYSVERFMRGANGTFGSPREVRNWLASLCGRGETDRQ
jgi:trehalose 6-phosphate phosphatase